MAQQVVEAEVLTGQARNPVGAQQTRGLTPQMVLNLTPDREGGLVPFGRRVRLQDDEAVNVTLPTSDKLVGYDETGIASFVDDEPGIPM